MVEVMPAVLAPAKVYIKGSRVNFAIITLLLAISGDIELNPGPYKHPCGNCRKPVRSNQRGICCDECDKWFHMQCGGLTPTEYARLSNSPESWVCTASLTQINREQQERQHNNRL